MPWAPRVRREEAADAIARARSWRDVLDALGYAYHGKNIETMRKWSRRWGIAIDHLSDGGGRARTRYTDAELRQAVAASRSWAETLRRLGYCPTGGNWQTLKKRVAGLAISTEHFDPHAAARERGRNRRIPLDRILVVGSTYSRSCLKRRLYESGLKRRRCELCGQSELWRGRKIGLILDHINGVRDDNRLENLRIVCPNCAAALDTHCGRKNRIAVEPRECLRCAARFTARYPRQRYCSRYCGSRWDRRGVERPGARKAERPAHDVLLREVKELGYRATGRKHSVSDNAVRKWLREYERERARSMGVDPDSVQIPTGTWPNRHRGP